MKDKPGWKTSEFWLSLTAAVCSFVYASGILENSVDWDDRAVAVVAGVVASLGYSVSRTLVKRA